MVEAGEWELFLLVPGRTLRADCCYFFGQLSFDTDYRDQFWLR